MDDEYVLVVSACDGIGESVLSGTKLTNKKIKIDRLSVSYRILFLTQPLHPLPSFLL